MGVGGGLEIQIFAEDPKWMTPKANLDSLLKQHFMIINVLA